MYKIGTISQKNIFLPLFAYDITLVENGENGENFFGCFLQKFCQKSHKGPKRGILVLFDPQMFYKPLKHSPKHA